MLKKKRGKEEEKKETLCKFSAGLHDEACAMGYSEGIRFKVLLKRFIQPVQKHGTRNDDNEIKLHVGQRRAASK